MKWIIVAAAILVAMPTLAQKPSAGDYYEGCAAVSDDEKSSEVPPEQRAAASKCLGAVSVVLFYAKENGICPPAPVSQPEAAAVVTRHLDENPDDLKEPFRSVARDALSEEFPCDTKT